MNELIRLLADQNAGIVTIIVIVTLVVGRGVQWLWKEIKDHRKTASEKEDNHVVYVRDIESQFRTSLEERTKILEGQVTDLLRERNECTEELTKTKVRIRELEVRMERFLNS